MDNSVKIKIIRSDNVVFEIDNETWFSQVRQFSGWGELENDITTVDNSIGHGGIISSKRISVKDRTIVAVCVDKNQKRALRAVAASFFNTTQTYKIYIEYMGKTLWCEGTIHKLYLSSYEEEAPVFLSITFLCPNPFLRSFDNFGQNIASVEGMIAFPFACGITDGFAKGITGGRFNFAQIIVLENDGDVETYCKAVFRATGVVTNPKLIINKNYVRVLDTMQDGDEIVMDFTASPPTVTKNGRNFIGHCDRTSAFDEMILIRGESEVEYGADSGSNLLEVSIYYNKLYGVI